MKLTTNYSLKKPEGSDVVNIDDFNYNADIIDTNLSDLDKRVCNGQNFKLTENDGAYTHILNSGNLDDAVLGWFNYCNAGGTLPSGYTNDNNDFIVENKGPNTNWFRQIIYDVRSFRKFERIRTNGTWSAWVEDNGTGYQYSNDITLLNGTYYQSWAEPSYVVKIGKVCILHCVVSNRAVTVGTELFRIPSFAIPKQHHRFFGRGEVANEAKKIVLDYDVETSGVVRYYGNNNPVDELHTMYINAVWEVE